MAQVRIDRDPPIDYWMVEFDKHGNEVLDSGQLASDEVLSRLRADPITDVFVVSHGWKGTWASSRPAYDDWIRAFADARPASPARPFRPLVVAVQWPAQWFVPEGVDRDTAGKTLSGGDAEPELGPDDRPLPRASVATLVDEYAQMLGDTPANRDALRRVFEGKKDAEAALDELREAVALDEPPLDDAADEIDGPPTPEGGVLGGPLDGLLGILRQFSFWTMKQRAYTVGSTGVANLLRALQKAAGRQGRVHVVGHSFGCIVVSAAVYGQGQPPARPVSSMLLLQGALSLWAFADDAFGTGQRGRFADLRTPAYLAGAIVATQSSHDQALGFWYPKGVGFRKGHHLTLGDDPTTVRWGAVGAFGIQGAGAKSTTIDEVTARTRFAPGAIYNVDASSAIIRPDGGDAHGTLGSPEVGRLAWRTAMSAP